MSRTEEAATRRLNPTTHSQRAIPSDVRQPSQETPSNPRDNSEIGDSDSGSSNAEKYAGNPVKQYNRALKGRRKKSLTLHSVVTPKRGSGRSMWKRKWWVGEKRWLVWGKRRRDLEEQEDWGLEGLLGLTPDI